MHQLITEDAVVVANVITEDAVTGAVAGALLRFFPPIPSNTIKVMTLGIQATLSYLGGRSVIEKLQIVGYLEAPMNNFVAAKRDLK